MRVAGHPHACQAKFGWGEPAPWFKAAALSGNPSYSFDTVAGRHVLLFFMGSAKLGPCAAALELIQKHRQLFDDERASFFGITVDPVDAASGRIAQQLPGIRYFLDYDRAVSELYGASRGETYEPHWLLLDPRLRVIERFRVDQADDAIASLQASLLEKATSEESWAPVLIVPRIFEFDLCRHLIDLYEADGGEPSGFMRDVDGKTVLVTDPVHKQRRDFMIQDQSLRQRIAARITSRLGPAIQRAFQFEPTRMERYLVARYEAGAGHFRPHRDNTTMGTAHRKFAVTLNLNAEAYEGGDLCFPEFGPRTYRAPTGGAIVFSCSLLHEARPINRGKRYAFLPFLYDEAAATLREANNKHLGSGVDAYSKG